MSEWRSLGETDLLDLPEDEAIAILGKSVFDELKKIQTMERQIMKVVEFYNTGVCESEPKSIEKLSDQPGLLHALLNELQNLEETDHLQVRIIEMTEAEWDEAMKAGEEMA